MQRQYCGALGKIGNCQVAVSSALIADGRTWPLAFDLYLPTAWTEDAARREAVGIPATNEEVLDRVQGYLAALLQNSQVVGEHWPDSEGKRRWPLCQSMAGQSLTLT